MMSATREALSPSRCESFLTRPGCGLQPTDHLRALARRCVMIRIATSWYYSGETQAHLPCRVILGRADTWVTLGSLTAPTGPSACRSLHPLAATRPIWFTTVTGIVR